MRNNDYSKPIYSTSEIHCAVTEFHQPHMTEEQFFKWLKSQPVGAKIVRLRCKYSPNAEWDYENEILDWCAGEYYWSNDWNEAIYDVEILGCISVDEVQVPNFKTNEVT